MANQISIIVPCYNSAETIKKCISHVQQSLQNYDDNIDYKLIVVNDGSQDNTANILKTINTGRPTGGEMGRQAGARRPPALPPPARSFMP